MLTYFGAWPGYETTPFKERYRLIKQAGFDATLVWWDEEDPAQGDYLTQPEEARRAGLYVENMHASTTGAGHFWEDTTAGQAVYNYYMMCIGDCAAFEIPTMVMHTGRGAERLPPMSEIGLERFARMIDKAERLGVNIAIENQGCPEKTGRAMEMLERFDAPRLGMCYDSGHGNIDRSLGRGVEMLARFGHRLKALHLNDNDGSGDQHRLPFDGTIDWPPLMKQIAQTGYAGPTTLELGIYAELAVEEYLTRALEQARQLEALRNA